MAQDRLGYFVSKLAWANISDSWAVPLCSYICHQFLLSFRLNKPWIRSSLATNLLNILIKYSKYLDEVNFNIWRNKQTLMVAICVTAIVVWYLICIETTTKVSIIKHWDYLKAFQNRIWFHWNSEMFNLVNPLSTITSNGKYKWNLLLKSNGINSGKRKDFWNTLFQCALESIQFLSSFKTNYSGSFLFFLKHFLYIFPLFNCNQLKNLISSLYEYIKR